MIDAFPMVSQRIFPQPNGQLTLPGTPPEIRLPIEELAALIEALLLIATEPPTLDELAQAAMVGRDRIELALLLMSDQESRGVLVQRHGDRVQLATAPRFSSVVRSFLGIDREARLSPASLETLAIVAYQQPVTRAEIESVRGVDCSGVLSTLHARELIEPVSRLASVGNPIQYGTSVHFLKLFGLQSLADLPALGKVNGQDGRAALELAAGGSGLVVSAEVARRADEAGDS